MLGTGNFNERCPHCNERVCVHDRFTVHDYPDGEFTFDCPSCEKEVHAYVTMVAEFELHKQEEVDAEEKRQRARFEAYIAESDARAASDRDGGEVAPEASDV